MRTRWLVVVAALGCSRAPSRSEVTPAAAPVTRIDLLKQVLPAGDFRNVGVAVVELAPGAGAPSHRHDVAVVAYVLEGEVENQFGAGAREIRRVGESWWEAPGTEHIVARNVSPTARARLLVVYIGEEGKANSVPLSSSPP